MRKACYALLQVHSQGIRITRRLNRRGGEQFWSILFVMSDYTLGRTIVVWRWYLPRLSAYETSHGSSPSKNNTWAIPSLA